MLRGTTLCGARTAPPRLCPKDASGESMLKNLTTLTVSRRLGLLVVLAIAASLAIMMLQLVMLRGAMLEERKAAIKGQVQTAVSIIGEFTAAVQKGAMSEADAQKQAIAVLRDIRWGDGKLKDYLFIYRENGVNIMAGPISAIEGKNLIDAKDPDGFHYVRAFIASGALPDGGFNSYRYPRPGNGDAPLPKLSYSLDARPWNWVVSTGVYVDDLDTAFYASVRQVLIWAAGLVGALCVAAFLLARGLVKPLHAVTGAMSELAAGNLDVVIPGADRRDELGRVAKAVEVFKVNAVAQKKLEGEQKEVEARSAAQRRSDMIGLATKFERAVGGIIDTVSAASSELEATASTLTRTADMTQQMSASVNAASEAASSNVQAVASATDQMTASIGEIGRQVQNSSRIASEAVTQAEKTDARVNELSTAASRIGDVVKLITAIAEQTNLLALNATIEAARAGEAGRGFAVVAQEVKALAAQTAKATGDISTQISGMQAATQDSVAAIKEISGTIQQISEIATVIAAAVEQQNAATGDISRNIRQAASGTTEVASSITKVTQGAQETGAASSEMLSSARSLAKDCTHLRDEVGRFLESIKAA
jgi:methyl-accepting chemotaxis protein